MKTQKLIIAGPNLDDQTKGDFQVHKPGCKHLAKIGGHQHEVEFSSKRALIGDLFQDFMDPDVLDCWEAFEQEVHFAPCVKNLPRTEWD